MSTKDLINLQRMEKDAEEQMIGQLSSLSKIGMQRNPQPGDPQEPTNLQIEVLHLLIVWLIVYRSNNVSLTSPILAIDTSWRRMDSTLQYSPEQKRRCRSYYATPE
jgi:hypothetical protein